MEVALYHPEHGYYRRPRDPFGKARRLLHRRTDPARLRNPDCRAHPPALSRDGRARAISRWSNWARDAARWRTRSPSGATFRSISIPARCRERFTASFSPMSSSTRCRSRSPSIGWRASASSSSRFADGRFRWQTGEPVRAGADDYLRRYFPPPEEGRWYEVNLDALAWMERIARSLDQRLTCSPSITDSRARSRVRFPAGTLMGYRRHTAREDVLDGSGRARHHRARQLHRARGDAAPRCGLRSERFETLAQTLLAAGEPRPVRRGAAAGAMQRKNCAARHAAKTCCSGWERRSGCCCRGRRTVGDSRNGGKSLKNEKGPGNRGLGVKPVCSPFQGAPKLLLFLRSSLFLRGGFLGCALHRLILPNIKFCDLKIAM